MKNVIIAIVLSFIVGTPFSLQAVQSIPKNKATHHPVNFSKKKHKGHFLQRIILRKIQRKLDRKIRKQAKRKNELPNKSLVFGIGSILVLGVELWVATSLSMIGSSLFFLLLLGFNLTAFLFGIAGISNGIKYLRKNRKDPTVQPKKGDWKTTIGIVLGAIGVLTSVVTFILGVLLLSYFG